MHAATRLPLVAAALLACGPAEGGDGRKGQAAGSPAPLAPVRVAAPHHTGYLERARLVLRTEAEWAAAWATLHARRTPVPPLPEVDFAKDMLRLAAMGERSSGGHSIAIPSAAVAGGALRVEVVETSPGQGCISTMALTQPAAVVRVARFDGPVAFDERSVVAACR